jgi:FkbM family methyltransferase
MSEFRSGGWQRTVRLARGLQQLGALRQSSPAARAMIAWGIRRLRSREVTIRYGEGAGLRFNAAGSNVGYALGTSEPLVQQALVDCLRAGDVVYDVGANVGFLTLLAARRVGPQGHVVAFEPMPEAAAAARHNVALNGMTHVSVYEIGLGARAGVAEFLLAPELTWGKLAATGARPDTTGSIRVDVAVIDDLVRNNELPAPSLVKIDVEGGEGDVLRGMAWTARAHGPLVLCEMHDTNRIVAGLLSEFGYWQVVIEEPDRSVREAHWNAHVLAGPPSRDEVRRPFATR